MQWVPHHALHLQRAAFVQWFIVLLFKLRVTDLIFYSTSLTDRNIQQYAVGSTPHLTSATSCLCAMVYLLALQTKGHWFDFLLNQSYSQEYTAIGSKFHTTPNIWTSCLCAMVYLLAFQTKGHRFDFLLNQSYRQEYTAICSRFHTTPYICSGLPLCNGLSSCFSN